MIVSYLGKQCLVIGYTQDDELIIKRQRQPVGHFNTTVKTSVLAKENDINYLADIWWELLVDTSR